MISQLLNLDLANDYNTIEDIALDNILFEISDVDNDISDLVVSIGPKSGDESKIEDIIFSYDSNGKGTIKIIPVEYENGYVTIVITVSDGDLYDTEEFEIWIEPVADDPILENDVVYTDKNEPILIYVLENDFDPDGDGLEFVLNEHGTFDINPTFGTLEIVDDAIKYTPATDFTGFAYFQYKAKNASATETAMVSISVGIPEQPPFISSLANQTMYQNESLGNLEFFIDPIVSNDILSVEVSSNNLDLFPNGSVVITNPTEFGETHLLELNPATNKYGVAKITLTVLDANGDPTDSTISFNVRVFPVNTPPVAGLVEKTILEDTSITIDLLEEASDFETNKEDLIVVLVTEPSQGTITLSADNRYVTYKPKKDYNGSDTFSYVVSDGVLFSNLGTVDITITPVNDPPEARNLTKLFQMLLMQVSLSI